MLYIKQYFQTTVTNEIPVQSPLLRKIIIRNVRLILSEEDSEYRKKGKQRRVSEKILAIINTNRTSKVSEISKVVRSRHKSKIYLLRLSYLALYNYLSNNSIKKASYLCTKSFKGLTMQLFLRIFNNGKNYFIE